MLSQQREETKNGDFSEEVSQSTKQIAAAVESGAEVKRTSQLSISLAIEIGRVFVGRKRRQSTFHFCLSVCISIYLIHAITR